MYLLPITTYFDYWRATRTWGTYLGGLAVFTVGTQYSTLTVPEKIQATPPPVLVAAQSSKGLGLEVGFSETRQRALNLQGRGAFGSGTVSRGLASKETVSRGVLRQVLNDQRVEEDGDERSDQDVGNNQELETGQETTADQQARTKMTSKITIEDSEIPFDTQYIESEALSPGQSEIQSVGEKGVYRRVLKTFEVDGKPVDQQVQSSYELVSPKKEVILRNSKPVPKKKVIIQRPESIGDTTIDLNKLNIRRTLTVEATAYTYTGNKTASGLEPQEGMIAVDPNVIAMGSKVYVEGYGYAIAADTGGDIRGNRIDVFFTSLRKCVNWGRRPVHIYVLNPI
jgi:Uncharacterized protein conserved in bacteria